MTVQKKKSTRSRSSSSGSRSVSKKKSSISQNGFDLQRTIQAIRAWLNADQRRMVAVALILLVFVFQVARPFGGSQAPYAQSQGLRANGGGDAYGDDAEFEEETTKAPTKKKKPAPKGPPLEGMEADIAAATGKVHGPEKAVPATAYNVKVRPLEVRENLVICPDKGGGSENKICSKAYAEYLFKVPSPGAYYVYVESVAPNINDNSLWIGAPSLDSSGFASCPSAKAGPLVPHKHVKSKKWLCCPKYLANNAKKGQGQFYCDCCITSIGPKQNEMGCILDLEVSTGPQWNMLPRLLKVTSTSDPLPVRLYAREDGTGFTRVLLSSDPNLSAKDIS
mmetsp:Transcript_5539/g.10404  ORF Transcript_5539/g.10404 Transcript_5539/m.10404 type:complete len:336 (+) Transcript_5539:136-1143(+)